MHFTCTTTEAARPEHSRMRPKDDETKAEANFHETEIEAKRFGLEAD